MQIPFAAYADDCTVTGQLALDSDRLTDFLSATQEFKVDEAAFRALDDGRVVEAGSAEILLGDLCVVTATGPRGRPERRLWTRQVPVRVRVGPYTVVGYLHAPPTIDPFSAADRRAIVPLTASVVEYAIAGGVARDQADAVLVNRLKIDRLEPALATDLRHPTAPELPTVLDAQSKDMTDAP
jgi:hypothetical protein